MCNLSICAGFAVCFTCEHELVGVVGERKGVQRNLHPHLSSVGPDHFRVVDWEPLLRFNGHTEEP